MTKRFTDRKQAGMSGDIERNDSLKHTYSIKASDEQIIVEIN